MRQAKIHDSPPSEEEKLDASERCWRGSFDVPEAGEADDSGCASGSGSGRPDAFPAGDVGVWRYAAISSRMVARNLCSCMAARRSSNGRHSSSSDGMGGQANKAHDFKSFDARRHTLVMRHLKKKGCRDLRGHPRQHRPQRELAQARGEAASLMTAWARSNEIARSSGSLSEFLAASSTASQISLATSEGSDGIEVLSTFIKGLRCPFVGVDTDNQPRRSAEGGSSPKLPATTAHRAQPSSLKNPLRTKPVPPKGRCSCGVAFRFGQFRPDQAPLGWGKLLSRDALPAGLLNGYGKLGADLRTNGERLAQVADGCPRFFGELGLFSRRQGVQV